jgi:predicted nucleic acid-binding protein
LIILDTNVISEAVRLAPDPAVRAWLDEQDVETLFLTAISAAELRHGVAALPDGKRRRALSLSLEERILPLFANRVLPFDDDASKAYATIRVRAHKAGKAISAADGYIAATAASRGFAIATRDTGPFEAAGVPVINPWLQRA